MTPQQAIRAANKYLTAGNKALAIELLRHVLAGAPDPTEIRIATNRLKDLGVEMPPRTRTRRALGEGSSLRPELRTALMELVRPHLEGLGSPLPQGTHRSIAQKLELPPALIHRIINDVQRGIDPFTLPPPREPPPPPPPRPPAPPRVGPPSGGRPPGRPMGPGGKPPIRRGPPPRRPKPRGF